MRFGQPPSEVVTGLTRRGERGLALADLAQQADHFDGDQGRFGAFVTGFGAGAFDGLFDVVGGEDAVDDGDVVFEGDAAECFGTFADNDVEVCGRAFDDRAEGADAVEIPSAEPPSVGLMTTGNDTDPSSADSTFDAPS